MQVRHRHIMHSTAGMKRTRVSQQPPTHSTNWNLTRSPGTSWEGLLAGALGGAMLARDDTPGGPWPAGHHHSSWQVGGSKIHSSNSTTCIQHGCRGKPGTGLQLS
jgi:hypothetical protein